ncbi:MAG: CMP-N-acetylneuraminate monooxygenase [Pseudomonadales bacterium]|nr:CMP-N-acetylneuraminate monooxygenase [Pseudomonadales bacterium]
MPRNPWYNPDKYHHTKNGFRNPPGSPTRPAVSAEIAREAAHFAGELMRLAGDNPFPSDHSLTEEQALAGYNRLADQDKILWLGHASFLIQLGGVTFLTDPYLTDYASPVPSRSTKRLLPAAIDIDRLPRVDCILVSHNHYDHLDTKALGRLARRFTQAQVVVPLGLIPIMQKQGFDNVVELDWYDQQQWDRYQVTALPAVHMSRRGLFDLNKTLWCGFALQCNGKQIYFAGDTAYGAVFKEIGQVIGGFDLGLVPIGAYQPRSLMSSVHTTPEEAILIGEDIGARRLVGMHWGTIRLTTEPMLEPKERFLAAQSDLPRLVMKIGESLAID